MKKLLSISIFCLCLLTSCLASKPISTVTPSNNKGYSVSYLFEIDGCKVYRFIDGGALAYFSTCNNGLSSVIPDTSKVNLPTKKN